MHKNWKLPGTFRDRENASRCCQPSECVFLSVCVCVCVCVCVLAISLLVKTTRMSQKQLVQDKHWLGHMFTID